MRIGIDARELEGRRTGVGRYLDQVLRAFGQNPDARAHTYVLFTRQPIELEPYSPLQIEAHVCTGGGLLWEQFRLPVLLRRTRVDILFAPGYTAPLWSPCPVVLVVHDVSFCVHPEWFGWKEGARRRVITRLAAARAARVVTVSQFSRHEVSTHLDVPSSRVTVIPNGVTRFTRTGHADPDPDEPLVLYLGSIFNRRHVPELIQALGALWRRGRRVRLEIVGDNRTTPRMNLVDIARSAGIAERVEIRNYVADAQIGACYSRARAFAFLSDYEGFGLTPLEALSAGVPVVVLDSAVTREVYGDAAIYVADLDPDLVASAIETALFDSHERARRLQAADAVLARYDWAKSASALLSVFHDEHARTRSI